MSKTLHTRPGLCSHYYPGGAPVIRKVVHNETGEKVTIVEPEPRVLSAYNAWRVFGGDIPLELELETVQLARELLAPELLVATLTSGIVCDMTADLLFDSLKLGLCPEHERSSSISISRTLTEPHEPGSRLRPAVKSYEVPCGLDLNEFKCTHTKFILCWINKPDGLRDIMQTMYMLYVGRKMHA